MNKRFTIQDLKASAVADINRQVIEEAQKPPKKTTSPVPRQECTQVQWMWNQLAWWSLHTGMEVKREHIFHPERKWRFDFCLPDKMLAIEYEGLNSEKSGHTTLVGYTKDTEKYNAAQALGWKVIRFTVKNYKTVLKELGKQLK